LGGLTLIGEIIYIVSEILSSCLNNPKPVVVHCSFAAVMVNSG
jgi:hypothetical protein